MVAMVAMLGSCDVEPLGLESYGLYNRMAGLYNGIVGLYNGMVGRSLQDQVGVRADLYI